jgi:hypothetical protein
MECVPTFRSKLKSRVKLIAFLMVGGCIMTLLTCRSCLINFDRYLIVAAFFVIIWIAMWIGNEFIVDQIDKKISWTKEPIKRFIAGVGAMLAYTALSVYLLVLVFNQIGFYIGNFSGTLYGTVIVTSLITVFLTSRSFLFKWRQAAIDKEKLEKEGMAARYESLKNQVNPHFLFNTLNALTNLVYEDQDKAAKFIKQLSEVYRYVLETRDRELVKLEEESAFLEAYLFLQQIRFGDKLKLEVTLDSAKGLVAPLVLQMLIENAIKHNIISEDQPLTVRVFCEADYLIVANTLQQKNVIRDESPGVGLENICKRYEFLTDRKVIISKGDKFVVRLPLIPTIV